MSRKAAAPTQPAGLTPCRFRGYESGKSSTLIPESVRVSGAGTGTRGLSLGGGSVAPAGEDAQEEQEDVQGIQEDRRGDERSRVQALGSAQPLEVVHGQPREDHQA